MAKSGQSNATSARPRPWVALVAIVALLLLAALALHEIKNPAETARPELPSREAAEASTDRPASPPLSAPANGPMNVPASGVNGNFPRAAPNAHDLSSSNAALRARISDLESQLAMLRTQLTNIATSKDSGTNDSGAAFNGTWKYSYTDACGAATREVTVSGAGAGLTIHALTMDNCGTYDYGTVPLSLVNAANPGSDGQSYPSGFASFAGESGEGGFQDPHRLFLVVTFEPQGLLTVWVSSINCVNCVPSWQTNFMMQTL